MRKGLTAVFVLSLLCAIVLTVIMHYPSEQVPNEVTKPRVIDSKAEAANFLLARFSVTELKEFARKINSGTPQEKEEVKDILKQRMTEEEYEAINKVLESELKKDTK